MVTSRADNLARHHLGQWLSALNTIEAMGEVDHPTDRAHVGFRLVFNEGHEIAHTVFSPKPAKYTMRSYIDIIRESSSLITKDEISEILCLLGFREHNVPFQKPCWIYENDGAFLGAVLDEHKATLLLFRNRTGPRPDAVIDLTKIDAGTLGAKVNAVMVTQ